MRLILLLVLCLSLPGFTFATDYYVGGAGASDSNPGTAAQPFATIQKAANVAKTGDIVNIRAGVYRETITPVNSGGVYQPDNGASVVISGLNIADGGWTVHNGNIYKKTVTLPDPNNFVDKVGGSNTVLLANQVFKDGEMMHLARWPKVSVPEDFLEKSKLRPRSSTSGYTNTSVTDGGIPVAAPGLVGAFIFHNGWFISQTRQITGHSGNTLNYAACIGGTQWYQHYYITNKLALLTQAKEWHYENGTLYFWQNGGGSPTGVEYKARNWGFDLRGKSNITIYGLQFIGCDPVNADTSSPNIIVDNIRAKYINHSFIHSDGGNDYQATARQAGIKLLGPNSVIRNSEITYAGATGIWLGQGCKAENNLLKDIAYDGMWGAPFKPWPNTHNQVITRNTTSRCARGAVELNTNVSSSNLNVDIGYNDFSGHNKLNIDGGAIYMFYYDDHTGTRIHHNWFHDTGNPYTGVNDEGIQVTGVYMDQASGPITVDHNVHWNGAEADMYTDTDFQGYDGNTRTAVNKVYNNTFASTNGTHSYVNYRNVKDVQKNNLYLNSIQVNGAPDITNSILKGVNPGFLGAGAGGLAYRLKAGSPAINTGMAIAGITDGSVGNPDMGAYEFGGTDWVPGYKAVPFVQGNAFPAVSITAPATNTTFAVGASVTISATASDSDGTVARVEFFDGATKIGEDLTSPYTFVWATATAGTHVVTAKATDNGGFATTSPAINVIVASAGTPPTTAITTPSTNALMPTGTTITINATATDNGSIAKVEFYSGTTKIGEDAAGPYSLTWTNATVGTHILTVKAYDNENNITTSTAVTITVSANAVPVTAITAPANAAKINVGTAVVITATATDADGTIAKVEFYSGATKIGEDATGPYSFSWPNPPAGSYALTVKAYDNSNNITTSGVVNITVAAAPTGQNTAPAVEITAPVNNAKLVGGTPINISVTASDADGTVAKVEFYDGATKLGEDSSSPYAFDWTNASLGSHVITAKAIDNLSAIGTSAAVSITVTSPAASINPTISAGDDVDLVLPQNSAILTGSGSSSTGGTVEFLWKQISGPTTITVANPSTASIVLEGLVEGTYVFEISAIDADGLSATDRITINVSNGAVSTAALPRFFTPNSDGINDTWEWPQSQVAQTSELVVFNRFGQKVYENSAYNNTWDGNSQGKALQDDAYYYVIKRENQADLQGAVRIIR